MAREALGEVALDRVGVEAPALGLRVLRMGADQPAVGLEDLLDRGDRLLVLRIARQRRQVVGDRLLVQALGHRLVRVAELHLAHLRGLRRRDLGLDLRLVLLDREVLDPLHELLGLGGPGGLGVLDVDVDGVVVRARPVALAVLALGAEHEVLDAVVVALRLLELGRDLAPVHVGEHVAAQRHRRLAQEPLAAVGVEVLDALVQLGELVHVVVDRRLGPVGAALQELDVGLHRDRAAEVHGPPLLPEELVDELLRALEVARALARGRLVARHAQVHLARLARDVAPGVRVLVAVLAVEELEERLVALGRLGELLVGDQQLAVGVAGLEVEVAQPLRRRGELLEELAVDLGALLLLALLEVVVRDLEARRPVLAAVAVGQRGDLRLGHGEHSQREHAPDLDGEEQRVGLGPLLLRGRDDRLGEVGEPAVDQRLDVADLGLQRLVDLALVGRGRRLLGGRGGRRDGGQHERGATEYR